MQKSFCDLCGKVCKKNYEYVVRICFPYDRSWDGAEYSDDNVCFDLCDDCRWKIYKAFVRKLKKDKVIEGKLPELKDWLEHKEFVRQLWRSRKIDYYDMGQYVKTVWRKKMKHRED